MAVNVRFGSKADIGSSPVDVRYAPKSGHQFGLELKGRQHLVPNCIRRTQGAANPRAELVVDFVALSANKNPREAGMK